MPVAKLVSETAATEREVNSELPAKTVGEREVTVRPHSLLRPAAQPDRMTSNERGSLLRSPLEDIAILTPSAAAERERESEREGN